MPGLGALPCPIMAGNAKLSAPLLRCVCVDACQLNILENSEKNYTFKFFLIQYFLIKIY
jgi:hypothetical protein